MSRDAFQHKLDRVRRPPPLRSLCWCLELLAATWAWEHRAHLRGDTLDAALLVFLVMLLHRSVAEKGRM